MLQRPCSFDGNGGRRRSIPLSLVAVLKEKLDSSYISEEDQERMRIIQLSKDNMPFSSSHSRQLHMMYEG